MVKVEKLQLKFFQVHLFCVTVEFELLLIIDIRAQKDDSNSSFRLTLNYKFSILFCKLKHFWMIFQSPLQLTAQRRPSRKREEGKPDDEPTFEQ